jgi:hypothetical protein
MSKTSTAAEWLRKAADTRQLAETMIDPGACRTLLLIAAAYEKMARYAESLQKLKLPTGSGG